MLVWRTERLLWAAAEPTTERFREDRKRLPERLRPLLVDMERHLFDPDFEVREMARRCGFRANSVSTLLTATLGQSPTDYMREARLEVACRLLGSSELKLWQVAQLVGYGSEDTFGKAFKRLYGVTPTDFHEADQTVRARFPPLAPELDSLRAAERAHSGEMEQEKAEALLSRLEAIYGHGEEEPVAPLPIVLDPALCKETEAAHVWRTIREAPYEKSRSTVQRYGSRALFDLLRQKSREEGRGDAWRGVELAQLAVESLDGCADELGEAVHDLRALGWAWVANARRFVPSRPGAEEAFHQADVAWRMPRANPDPEVEALLWDYKAALRSYERRFEEALALEDRAVERYRSLAASSALAGALIERGKVHLYAGKPAAAIVDNREALDLLGEDDVLLRLSGCQILAIAHVRLEDFSSAAEALGYARRFSSQCGDRGAALKIRQVEGLIHHGTGDAAEAETCLLEAREGLAQRDHLEDSAVVALDLAILYAEQDRLPEAASMAAEVVAVFEASRIERERLAALKVLGEAVARGAVSLEVLEAARDELRSVPTGRIGQHARPSAGASALGFDSWAVARDQTGASLHSAPPCGAARLPPA